jgi:thymidylate kinase
LLDSSDLISGVDSTVMTSPGSPSRRPPTVALVGPDGSGKSTVAQAVVKQIGIPARYLYMGVNLESSRDMLPTTRLVLAAKRRGGGRADMTARIPGPTERGGRWTPLDSVRSVARISAWIAEEAYRAILAARARGRGQVVVFDRHFFCDYYATDVRPRAPGEPHRRLASRIHGAVLRRWYPRPDLTIMLDAPAKVLFERKHEGTLEEIEERRHNYLALADVLPAFVVVDATRPLDEVVADVIARIVAFAAPGSALPTTSRMRASGARESISEEAAAFAPAPLVVES